MSMSRYIAVVEDSDSKALEEAIDTEHKIGGAKIIGKTKVKNTGYYNYTIELFEKYDSQLDNQTYSVP